jgi:hypothetical protein
MWYAPMLHKEDMAMFLGFLSEREPHIKICKYQDNFQERERTIGGGLIPG